VKYLLTCKKDDKYLLKIKFDDGKEKWATTSEEVFNYAKANFKKDEEATYEMAEKNGQYHVTKILKVGAVAPKQEEKTSSTTTEHKCSDCGKVLKDGKYTKCFECNKKNPAPREQKSKSTSDSIERQAMMKASAMAVGSTFVGNISNADTLADMIIVVYTKLLAKLRE